MSKFSNGEKTIDHIASDLIIIPMGLLVRQGMGYLYCMIKFWSLGTLALRICAVATLVGCERGTPSKPSIVVVAVEGLGFDRVSCESEDLVEGFALLCEESIRFTHAYSNSTTSLANLGSLLTGKLPEDHGLRGQSQWIRPHQLLASEVALSKGYRTAFISGGPPVLSKSGLGQGFENFDDRVPMNSRPYYRTAQQVTDLFFNWVDDDVSGSALFSFLYYPDFLFPFVPSLNRDGEAKELSVESKLTDIGDGLKDLIDGLKQRKMWNHTYVVLVGLHGGKSPRNMRSEQTQVTLLIKPPRVQRDQATQWGVDHNVSLIDVGATLFDILGAAIPSAGRAVSTTLASVFSNPQPKWPRDRWIFTEAYWPFELFGNDVLRSVRKEHLLYVNESTPVFYNTLMDRLEANPLRVSLDSVEYQDLLEGPVQNFVIPDWFFLGVKLYRQGDGDVDWGMSQHSLVDGWRARFNIEDRNWNSLLDVAHKSFRLDLEILARSKLGEPLPKTRKIQCEYLFVQEPAHQTMENARDICKADRLLSYLEWAHAKGTDKEIYYENRFRKSFQNWWSKLELGAINYANMGTMGLPLNWPLMPDISESYIIFREKKAQRFLIETQIFKSEIPL